MESKIRNIIIAISISGIIIVSIIGIGTFVMIGQNTSNTPLSINQWTWMSGDDTRNASGVYGTQGISNEANYPGARAGSASWIDESGNLWLFGGYGYDGVSSLPTSLNDLWIYNITTGEWTWMSGSKIAKALGVYGTKGVPDADNCPGARSYCSGLINGSDLWLFGGLGYSNETAGGGYLNDLWKYNILSNQWTWMAGNFTHNEWGNYINKGVADDLSYPGGRLGCAEWIDSTGNLWFFGGDGLDNHTGVNYPLGDLWKFDGTSWTWMSGNYSNNYPYGTLGTYGIKGVSDVNNIPGGRRYVTSWIDSNDYLWLFGGQGYDNVSLGYLNDLWLYNISSNEWTWMSGNYSVSSLGIYDEKGIGDAMTSPGGRMKSMSWIDSNGHFYLFGGYGWSNDTNHGCLNDLWRYNGTIWTWMSGNYSVDNMGSYGTKYIGNSSNIPGGRMSGISWIDASDDLWLFGGEGLDGTGSEGYLNDLWKYQI